MSERRYVIVNRNGVVRGRLAGEGFWPRHIPYPDADIARRAATYGGDRVFELVEVPDGQGD